MKKLFTLALVLLVAMAGYSQVRSMSHKDVKHNVATMQKANGFETLQNVQTEPTMMRAEPTELDYSTYDWQTNAGYITRTITWPDGIANFASTWASTTNYSDRGTNIATYDSEKDEWIPLGGRIENERTGFGSIARYKENGIVIAAHTADNLGIYIAEDKDNMTPECATGALYTNNPDYTHPSVMTSGPERDIIHVAAAKFTAWEGEVYEPIRYWRSSDGGQTWDKECVELPFTTPEYGINWGTNTYYWMETTEDNRLALVINNTWSDGMVIYSDDNGETWNRKVFYHHPDPFGTYPDSGWGFGCPRWTSCQWNANGELCMAYEWNGTNGVASSEDGGYFPGMGGVAFWSEYLPFQGYNDGSYGYGYDPTNPITPTHGQPFIIDSAYIYEDLYASWWPWSNANHEMWPEYFGSLAPLTDEGFWEDPYEATEFNIDVSEALGDLHGHYNCGICAMPILCMVPGTGGSDMVAVWMMMDENNMDADRYFFKLFANYSGDGGLTWSHFEPLTWDFQFTNSEFAYPQATVIGNTLVVAVQEDGAPGTYVQSEEGASQSANDNFYRGLTFELDELFPNAGVGVPEVSHNTHMSVYPNPAVNQLQVVLSQNADIVIYNMMGQSVMSVKGNAGVNSVNISELTAGVYFVNAGNDTQKLIVK